MELRWGARTHRGRVRPLNEDALLTAAPAFVVADGMGGHAAGEVASAITVDCFRQLSGAERVPAEDVMALLQEANERILDHAAANPDARGMGTTVTGLVVVQNGPSEELLAFNVGDSRLYRVRDGSLAQVSVDHSAVQELVDAGVLAPEDIGIHPDRHVVTRALGANPAPRPDLWFIVPERGDRFVLCTDGLSGEVNGHDLAAVATLEEDPQEVARRLTDIALSAGGRDNVTVVVVDVIRVTSEVDVESTAPRGGGTARDVERTNPRDDLPPLEDEPGVNRVLWSDREADHGHGRGDAAEQPGRVDVPAGPGSAHHGAPTV
jgi:protein phosphatase